MRVIIPVEQRYGTKRIDCHPPHHVSVVVATTAAGGHLTHQIILPVKKIPRDVEDFVSKSNEKWAFSGQKKGFINKSLWRDWVYMVLDPYVTTQRKSLGNDCCCLLLTDSHSSRLDCKALEHLIELGVDVLTFESHTTHVNQPNDRGKSIFQLFVFNFFWSFRYFQSL